MPPIGGPPRLGFYGVMPVVEYKHLTGRSSGKTSLTYEYPSADGGPYHPISREENRALYKR